MARERKKAEAPAEKKNFTNVEILHVKEFKNGNIGFDMKADGVTYYQLTVVEGKNGSFISTPSYKGSDGNYYHYYYLNITDQMQDLIIDMVDDMLAKQE